MCPLGLVTWDGHMGWVTWEWSHGTVTLNGSHGMVTWYGHIGLSHVMGHMGWVTWDGHMGFSHGMGHMGWSHRTVKWDGSHGMEAIFHQSEVSTRFNFNWVTAKFSLMIEPSISYLPGKCSYSTETQYLAFDSDTGDSHTRRLTHSQAYT